MSKWLDEPSTYKPEEMRACLDGWRDVLFNHLDEEVCTGLGLPRICQTHNPALMCLRRGQVRDLSAESLKKYWTVEEVARIHI